MFEQPVVTKVGGGIIYTDRCGPTHGATPLLCVHGIGGHHRNFALLNASLRDSVPRVIPVFVDVPGFGNARGEALSLRAIQKFLVTACSVIADALGRQVLLFQESAAVWLTLGLAAHPAINRQAMIAYNPVRIYRPSTQSLRNLLGQDVVDVRHEFLSRFFPPGRIQKMDNDDLGRPLITLAFLAELWGIQRSQLLEGWERAVVIETRLDPMREFRISLTGIDVERHEIDSTQHGIGEPAVAQQVSSIVQHMLDSL